jgi:membrane protein
MGNSDKAVDDRQDEISASDDSTGSPRDLTRSSWSYVLRRTAREFMKDECPDMAAALTYYAVLALFPAFIALVSLVGLVGEDRSSVDFLLGVLRDLKADSVAKTLEPTLLDLSEGSGAGLALFLGLAGALWSASGYTGAFGRAMNRMYGVREGRPVWKLRPLMLLLTAVLLVLTALTVAGLVLSGPVARSVGDSMGLGDTAVTVWGILKWPVLVFIVAVIVALLYWGTPNVRHPRFRWISVGAGLAIVSWVVLSALFGLYVSHFSSFSRTYGSLAGVIVFLLWLWITNLALLFGGELDTEIERGRELQLGLPAETRVQLEPRDSRNIEKLEEREREDQAEAKRIRLEHDAGSTEAPDADGRDRSRADES